MSRVVYHRAYNIGFFGLERLHPFDARKYLRAWKLLREHVSTSERVRPRRPASCDELLRVHSAAYLEQLRDPGYVAQALEIPLLRFLPRWLIDACVLKPMRWATRGTVLATHEALSQGFAVNLGGGFHHAKPEGGEGFCVYNDVALAMHQARAAGLLSEDARVAHVDLDAHLGNGVAHCFLEDPRALLFDAFNRSVYPHDPVARGRVDCALPLPGGCGEGDYLAALHAELPGFLDSAGQLGLAIYNAGTDVYERDALGGLNVSATGIRARDAFVVEQLRARGIPTVMLLSGGYSRESYRLVADSIQHLLKAETKSAQRPRGVTAR